MTFGHVTGAPANYLPLPSKQIKTMELGRAGRFRLCVQAVSLGQWFGPVVTTSGLDQLAGPVFVPPTDL